MKIATRLTLAGIAAIGVVAITSIILLSTTREVRRQLGDTAAAADILRGATAIRYLTVDYVLNREASAQAQWHLRDASLLRLLEGSRSFTDPEALEILAELRDARAASRELFAQLVANHETRSIASTAATGVEDELEARLTGQITSKIQAMISGALRLSELSRAGVLGAQRRATVAVAVSGIVVVLTMAAALLLTLRSVARPLAALRDGAAIVGGGNLDFRLDARSRDEIGDLARAFDAMTEKLKATTVSRYDLSLTNERLQSEIATRQETEQKVIAQLARLSLLNQIIHAIGERQDLASIFQVVVRSLEDDLPVDFACVCLRRRDEDVLTVMSIGSRSQPLARDLALTAETTIAIEENGLSRCMLGNLVYEPDIAGLDFKLPKRLASGGLRAAVMAPLRVESEVFGVLIAARLAASSFSSEECEFLRQLSDHVALAARQAQLYISLQEAYDELRRTQQSALQHERLRVLGQMASGIAHDINNAISPVTLYAEALLERETGLSARGRGYLETIQHAVEDVAQTVARMREFYRPREPFAEPAVVPLDAQVTRVLDLTRARWSDMPQQRGTSIVVRTSFAADVPAVLGSESEIREALTNLVVNAADAMPDGGTLTVATGVVERDRTGTSGGRAEAFVEVTDTGVGMDEETRSRCLEPFFTTKGERGTGLGLAMVYGVAQRHGAEIDIRSAPGAGTSVRLRFPVAGALAPTAAEPTPLARSQRLRLLVVDDDPALLKSLRDTLEGEGHVVHAATGGQAALDLFHSAQLHGETYSAVITDLGMPLVDGRAVAAAIRSASPATPIIMLTGWGWGQRLAASGERPMHVDHLLPKPVKLRDLRQVLALACPPTPS